MSWTCGISWITESFTGRIVGFLDGLLDVWVEGSRNCAAKGGARTTRGSAADEGVRMAGRTIKHRVYETNCWF